MLSACAVGPDYRAPAIALDAGYLDAGASAVNAATPGADIATFWRGFADPALSQLVERALAANGDVRIAQARLRESRALLEGTRAEQWPEIDAGAGASRALTPQFELPGASRSERTATVYDAGFTANWELDFFGRRRRASESAAARSTPPRPGSLRSAPRSSPRSRATTSSCAACSSASRSRRRRSPTSARRCA